MRKTGLMIALTGVLTGILLVGLVAGARAEDRRVLRCRVLAHDFMAELTRTIQDAIHDEGLAGAVGVCRQAVPELEARYSLPPGIKVRLVALQCCDADNRPDAWEKKGLEDFLERRRQGAILAGLEYHKPVAGQGQTVFRYLRALPTGSLCLQCHGERLSPKVKKAMRSNCSGSGSGAFRLAELRGALSITLYP